MAAPRRAKDITAGSLATWGPRGGTLLKVEMSRRLRNVQAAGNPCGSGGCANAEQGIPRRAPFNWT